MAKSKITGLYILQFNTYILFCNGNCYHVLRQYILISIKLNINPELNCLTSHLDSCDEKTKINDRSNNFNFTLTLINQICLIIFMANYQGRKEYL